MTCLYPALDTFQLSACDVSVPIALWKRAQAGHKLGISQSVPFQGLMTAL